MQLVRTQTCLIKQYVKKISLLLLSSMTLTACADTHVKGVNIDGSESLIVVKNTSVFEKCIPDHPYEDSDSKYFLGVSCRFESKVPDTFNITYATWLDRDKDTEQFYGQEIWINEPGVANKYISVDGQNLNSDKWMALGAKNRKKAIAQLPDSAWQTYTVNLKSTLEKYKDKTPEGRPRGIVIPLGLGMVYPSLFPSLKDRTLNLDIRIDKQGHVEVEEHYNWENELRQNPYA